MFKQPTVAKQAAPRDGKKHAKKGIPLPIAIPSILYSSIRLTCVVNALDQNPNNRLNDHQDPIVKVFTVQGVQQKFVLYSQDFIKSWLRFLFTIPMWCDLIDTPKVTKNRFGSVVTSSTENVRVSCLRLPTNAEIEEYSQGRDHIRRIFMATRAVVNKVLLRDNTLHTLKDLSIGELGDPSTVASPTNICRMDRLSSLGMSRLAIYGTEVKAWEEFYTSEKARLAYVTNSVRATRVSDKILKELNSTDADEYNRMVLSEVAESMKGYVNSEPLFDNVSNMVSAGNKVNPALVQLYINSNKSKATKAEGGESSIEKYKAMCKKYYTLTGYKLPLKEEKKNHTYDMRMNDIQWAEEYRAANPGYRFVHVEVLDRIKAVIGIISDEKLELLNTKAKETSKAVSTKVTRQPGAYKKAFTDVAIFGAVKPRTDVVPAATIRDQMVRNIKGTSSTQQSQQQQPQVAQGGVDEDEEDVYYGDDVDDAEGDQGEDGVHQEESDDADEDLIGRNSGDDEETGRDEEGEEEYYGDD